MRLPVVGDVFVSRYTLERVVGEGGFAKVFGARDPAGNLVALKVLSPTGKTYARETVARFDREVAILAQLRDPHTVQLLDSGKSPEGLLYMAFEYVPGTDLSEWLETRGPLEPAAARHVLRQVLQSLHEAHSAGLLHRDIKPENIRLFAEAGDEFRVKLLDFGIAKSPDRADMPSVTRTGELVGTPRYMSPEQLLSRPLTPASDIYSLGLVMCETIMGRDFLHGNRWQDQLERVRTGYVMSVPEMERIGPAFYSVLQRMVETTPGRRLGTAAAVLHALDEAEANPSVAMPLPPPQPVPAAAAPPMAPMHPPAAIPTNLGPAPGDNSRYAAVAAALVAAIALAGFVIFSMQQEPPPAATVVRHVVAPTELLRSAESEVVVEPLPVPSSGNVDAGAPAAERVLGDLCGKPPFRGFGHLIGDGGVRWVTYIPDTYGTKETHPLVVILPPDHIQPAKFVEQTRFDQLAEKHGFVISAPFDGERRAWTDEEDVTRIREQVIGTQKELCIDRERIYALGHNNSGKAIERLTCESWVAAAAANSYRPNVKEFFCKAPPVPFLLLAPLKTGHMPVEGGTNCYVSKKISHAEGIERWKRRHRCRGPAQTTFEHKGSKCETWACKEAFVACELDGGLGWPGSPRRPGADWKGCDGTPPDFPSEDVVWDFFAAQRLSARR